MACEMDSNAANPAMFAVAALVPRRWVPRKVARGPRSPEEAGADWELRHKSPWVG